MSFSFTAAPREAALFLLCAAVMALDGPVAALGAKLLVDAALRQDLPAALRAGGLLALAAGVGLLNTLSYLDFLFAVAEKAGLEANRRLMRLIGGVPGLAHHELPDYLKELDTLREQRGGLAWMTNATAGVVRVAVGLTASVALLGALNPALLLLPLFGFGSFWAGRKAQALQHAAAEATAEAERRRLHLFELGTSRGGQGAARLRPPGGADRAAPRQRRGRDPRPGPGGLAGRRPVRPRRPAVRHRLPRGHRPRAPGGPRRPGDGRGRRPRRRPRRRHGQRGLHRRRLRHLVPVLPAGRRPAPWLADYAAGQRLALADSPPRRPAGPAAGPPATPELPPLPERLTRGIELRDVTFRYPGAAGGRPVLDGVSLALPAGVVALVGENGAGKTTLVKLLCRFYEPDGGAVLVDGDDLRRVPLEAWRARTSATFQDFARFELLARETVGVGDLPRIDDRDAVDGRPGGGGGRRRAGPAPGPGDAAGESLARWRRAVRRAVAEAGPGRGMMRPRPLLVVFDEPATALDPQTEHALFERLAVASREGGRNAGTVTILVSHRFSTVRMADRIVVLDGGPVREQGSHPELMRRDGIYAEALPPAVPRLPLSPPAGLTGPGPGQAGRATVPSSPSSTSTNGRCASDVVERSVARAPIAASVGPSGTPNRSPARC